MSAYRFARSHAAAREVRRAVGSTAQAGCRLSSIVRHVIFDIGTRTVAKASDKPLVWLHGEIKTPPFSEAGRLEAGFLLRRLQQGEKLSLPQSRPMPGIGAPSYASMTQTERGE